MLPNQTLDLGFATGVPSLDGDPESDQHLCLMTNCDLQHERTLCHLFHLLFSLAVLDSFMIF